MIKFEVGQIIPEAVGHEEGVKFDIADDGAMMIVYFNKPTDDEMKQFSSNNPYEIRFSEFKNVTVITTKIGNLNWMDAPYSPHLSPNLTKYTLPGEGQGLALILMLVDSATGEIKSMRMMGLSEQFTKKLFGCVMEQKMRPFNREEYATDINRIFSAYSTKKIADQATAYCKVR